MSAFLIGFIFLVFLILPNPVLAGNTSSLNLDGSNDYAEADGVNALVVSSAFSFGAWVRPTTTTTVGKGLGGFYTSTGVNNNLLFWNFTGQAARYSYLNPSVALHSTHTFPSGVWTHVFATTDSSNNLTLYVNGQIEGTGTNTIKPVANGLFTIGQDYDNGNVTSDYWLGQIDDYRVYNKALTQDQVKKVMRDDYGDGLVGHWKFDDNNSSCNSFDSTGRGNVAVLMPTCSSDIPTYHTTIKAPLGVAGPNINDGVESKGYGDYKFIGRTTVEDSYIVDSINYSVNNSGWKGVDIKDGVNDESDEEFEFNFRSDENNPGYEGFLLDVRVTDSGNRESHRIHFEPFNLTSVKKLPDNNLQFQFNVHKNKDLMKDKLSEYQISYTGSKEGSKILLQNIPISSDTILDNDNMKIEYQNGSANLTVTTKNKFSEPEGKYTFKAVALSKDNLAYESNGQTLDTTPAKSISKSGPVTKSTATLGVSTSVSPSPSPSPSPFIQPYTPPQPKPQGKPTSGWNLGQTFVNFHLWLFSLFPWSPVP